jgi:pimeloyl-ACP methyl ester carboxylesterase
MTESSADEPGEAGPAPSAPPSGPPFAGRTRAELERAFERDLSGGRRLAALTWLVAILHAMLGVVSVRQSAMLVNVDDGLITTATVEAFGASFLAVRLGLVALTAIWLGLAVRWLRRAVPTFEALATLGGIEAYGPPGPGSGRGWRHRLGVVLRPAGVAPERVSWAEIRVGGDRRLAGGTLAVLVAAMAVGAVGAIGLMSAGRLETAQAWRWVVATDAGLWVVATILGGALVARIAWRLAVAGRAVGIFAPLSDAPGRLVVRTVPAVLLFAGLLPAIGSTPAGARVACPSTRLECAAVIVPVEHGGPAVQDTLAIVYGVHRASGPPKGTLVVAVGGPGGSGLKSADGMLESLDDKLVDRYDVVYWDQRGVGKSDGHDCPIAGGIFSSVETTGESARAFVDACLNESGTKGLDLRRYATAQAAEDLESIRARLGVERFVLYGESYGTSLAQVYAAAHPDRLSGLILDGAIDLTLSANDFWAAATKGFGHTLSATFDACESDSSCTADLADPASAYDRLLSRLGDSGGATVTYADLDGASRDHQLKKIDVKTAVGALLYEPAGRALVERAVAASAEGDDVLMSRLVDWFGPGINPVFSAFDYYAVMCGDYRVSPTDDPADLTALLDRGRAAGALPGPMEDVYLSQVPCLYWPNQSASSKRPAPLTGLSVPVIVLGATMDPITPIDLGRSIANRAADGYLIETSGGPHVTFGRGLPCVDGPVLAFLLEDRRPPRETHCSDDVASAYIPLTPLDAADFQDALDAMGSVENELLADPLYAWGVTGEIQSGCRYGGFVVISTSESRDTYDLAGCEFARGMPLNGTGTYDYDTDQMTLNVTFPDGSLEYTSGDRRTARGTFRGVEVDEHD